MKTTRPFPCPVEMCGKAYKSNCGLQYHLKSYDHDNPSPQTTPVATPKNGKNKKGRVRPAVSNKSVAAEASPIEMTEPLTHDEVQLEVDGQVLRVNIYENIDVVSKEDMKEESKHEKSEAEKKEPPVALPEAVFTKLDSYNICDAPARPNAYIRFIEKSAEELDGEVEYDVDEEDTAWLGIMNERREAAGLSPVSVDSLELLMDRLEKESYFQADMTGNTVVDDDAVCCICMDGECQNTNVILFCDMCNLAVHQDCYGVPYIPEGQWLCRRCLQSPSRAVDCVLCPNQGGAFKQTDRGHWAHVVCALWIPEVRFANTVFLEPIDSIETIPVARWRLTCYVCKQRGVGACIQCHKSNCYSAFHVTCAQQAGLYMKMDTIKDAGGDSQPVLVQKIAYCDVHTPVENGGPRDSTTSNVDTLELCKQLKYWQCLRQDLERARLLCELVRKREKLKVEYIKAKERWLKVTLKPVEASLRKVLTAIVAKDTNEIFSEPVDLDEVPDYMTVVTEPMDLRTMREKLEDGVYPDLAAMEKDFDLMIANCLAYNNKDTVFYKAAIKMRDQCATIFRQAKKELEAAGLVSDDKATTGTSNSHSEDSLATEIDKELENLHGKTGPEVISKLEELLVKSQALKHGLARAKRVKLVRSELNRAKKILANTDSSHSDGENESSDVKSASTQSSNSPSGVNRRTAVLFTRKAQAALKKPDGNEEKELNTPSNKQRKKGRPSRSAGTKSVCSETKSVDSIPDSFRVYRAGHQTSGEENSDSGTSLSTCYSHELSEIDSDDDSDTSHSTENVYEASQENTTATAELKPLQLVWAKCRGYPWYPALIIDPAMPKGYVHHGVPIPSPPPEVLALSVNYTEQVYLVLFFDAKRTWQWLPPEKLELLGADSERDEAKANEPRKPTDRKAVKRAYQNALSHLSQVNAASAVDRSN